MESMRQCAKCGTEISPYAPEGLCPECLLRDGLTASDEPTVAVAPTANPELSGTPGATEESARFFSDYELLETIAQGGMGIVYKARQLKLDRIVALKTLLLGPQASPESVKRFQVEVLAAASLQHPNIVAIHEVGFREGQHFFTMDFVNGPTLAALAQGRPLPAQRAARYLQAIAQAIHYAHERGILHRDLKPSNVLIDETDQPRVTDFGLAKRLEGESGLTLSGQVLGTPNYLPPEQAGGRRQHVGRASDVYALGAILYYLLSGRPPFMGETLETTLGQVLHQEPISLRLLNGSVPRDLETICLRCLEKEPLRRYATAQALADELERFQRGEPILARPIGPTGKVWRWCRRKPVVAGLSAGLVLALALGFAVSSWQWDLAQRNAQAEARQRLRAEANAYAADMKAAQAELQKENRGLALTLLRQYLPQSGKKDLRSVDWRYLWQQSQSDELRSVPHPEALCDAELSPDGQSLATYTYGVDRKTRVWDLRSGQLMREFPGGGTVSPKRALAFSPDGKWLVLRGPNGFEVRSTGDWGVQREFRSVEDTSPCCLDEHGKVLITCGAEGLQVWDLASGSCRVLTNEFGGGFNVALGAHGSVIAYSPAIALFNLRGPIVLWDIERNTTNTLAADQDVNSVAISPNGDYVASGHFLGEVSLWNLATRQPTQLQPDGQARAHRFGVWGLAFSPDGKLLATAGYDQVIRLWETASRKLWRTLRGHRGDIYRLSFSSDGQRLISASADGTARIWEVTPPPSLSHTFSSPINSIPVGFLPAGAGLLSVDPVVRAAQLRSLRNGDLVSSNAWDNVKALGCPHLRFFPKQDRLVGMTTNGAAHLWKLSTASHLRTIALGATNFVPNHLSPDERWLLGNPTNNASLMLYDLQAARQAAQFSFPWLWSYAAAFSPNGRWLVFSHQRSGSASVLAAWDLHHQQLAKTFGASDMQIYCLAFSSTGEILASGGSDRKLRLWSFPAATLLFDPLEGHFAGVFQVAFTADDKTLASVGCDGIRLWNTGSGRETLVFGDAMMAAGRIRVLMESYYRARAELDPLNRWLVWQEFQGPIHVTPLSTLAEIDASERARAEQERAIRQQFVESARKPAP